MKPMLRQQNNQQKIHKQKSNNQKRFRWWICRKKIVTKGTAVTLAKRIKVTLAKGTMMTLVLPQSESKRVKSRQMLLNNLNSKTTLLQRLSPRQSIGRKKT